MEINNGDGKAKILAYYLPQFYPTEFNDKWFGKGFTEWTNVGRAKPLFKGHYQPKIPADLGYYDMRVPEIAEQQVELAKRAGIAGFAYWSYWFGKGRKLLEMPSERMLATRRPNFPFCFVWANESWKKKMWDMTKKDKETVTMEQLYLGEEDNLEHFEYCLPFFKDERYIRFDGRPIFGIYRPLDFIDVDKFIQQWNKLAREYGLADSFYFIGTVSRSDQYDRLKSFGFDCITYEVLSKIDRLRNESRTLYVRVKRKLKEYFFKVSYLTKQVYMEEVLTSIWEDGFDNREDIAPILIPNYDHSPRSGRRCSIIVDSSPENWQKEVDIVLDGIKSKNNKIAFLRAWNEWGEGNYMEPDLRYGTKFIDILGETIEKKKEL